MFEPVGETRKLPFPLYNQVSNENTLEAFEDRPPFVFPEDPEERTLVPLWVSQREFTAIASAMDVGADIAYPLQYVEVMYILLRNLRYPPMICSMIIECLENDADTQAAIAELIANNPLIRQSLQSLIDNGSIITTPTEVIVQNDDLDALFGAITYLVDTMNGATSDLFEALEASTNKRELGEILFEAIPIVETLPFDEMSEYVDTLGSAIAENYAAQYTTTPETGMRDRLRCALFCLARDNDNSLSWELIANYFWGEVGFTASDYVDTFVDFVNFFLSGTWIGDEIVYISFANMAAALSTTQNFAAMSFPSLPSIMALGANDPDPDWEVLCLDCPPEPTDCYDLLTTQAPFTVLSGNASLYGTWISGEGLKSGSSQMAFNFTVPTANLTTFEVIFNGPVNGTINIRNQSGTQSAPIVIDTTDTADGAYTVVKPAGVMGTNLYLGFIPATTPSTSPYRIEGLCWG